MDNNSTNSRYYLFLCLAIIFVGCFTNIINFDLWWHLAGGKYNLTNGTILAKDVFSYTFKGYEWLNFEWFFELLFFLVYLWGGAALAIVTKALVVVASYLVLCKVIRVAEKTKTPLWAFIVVLLLYLGSRSRFLVRPQIFMFFFLISYYYVLVLYREANRNFLFVLVGLQFVWSGLHSSPFYGQMLVGFFLFEAIVKYFLERSEPISKTLRQPQIKNLGLCLIILLTTLIINPYHYLIYVFPFRAIKVIHEINIIGEWHPPGFSESFPFHYLGVLFAIISLPSLIRKRRYAEILFLLFLGISSFRYVRLIGIFLFMVTPIAIREIRGFPAPRFRRNLLDRQGVKEMMALLMVIGLTGISYWSFTSSFIRPGLSIQPKRYPQQAIQFIKTNIPQKRGLTIYNWGGYFIWRLYPEQETFIDGRGMPFLDVFNEYYYLFRSPQNWQNVLDKYDVEYIFFDRLSPEANELDQDFLPPEQWRLIYWDSLGALYLRNTPPNYSLIDRFGYRLLRPFYPHNSYLQPLLGQYPQDLQREISRAILTDPTNPTPFLMRGYLATITQDYQNAIENYSKTVELNPRHATAYFNLGQLYRHLKQLKRAEEAYAKAIKLNKSYDMAYIFLGLTYVEANKLKAAVTTLKQAVKLDNDSALANFSLGLALRLNKAGRADYYLSVAKDKIERTSAKERKEINDLIKTYKLSDGF